MKKEETPKNCQACELKELRAQTKLDILLLEKRDTKYMLGKKVDKKWLADIDKKIEEEERKLRAAKKAKKAEIIGRKTWRL
jgi:hypothetical protein